MRYLPIKNEKQFARDIKTNAIVRTNKKDLQEFNTKRAKILKEIQEKEETQKRISQIENDINCIKTLLQEMASIRSENAH